MSKAGRGRPRKHAETSPKSRRKERNSQRIYLGDIACRWTELKTAANFTDIQLARHLLDIHDSTCQCNSKPDQETTQCDPWDRSSQQECLQLPSISTPQKNRDVDIASHVADLSMISSLMSSPTSQETLENAEECYNSHCRDEPDDLSSNPDTLDETVNKTGATLGESIDALSSDDEFLNMSLPDMDDDACPDLEDGDKFMGPVSAKKCIAFVDQVVLLVKNSIGHICDKCKGSLVFSYTMSGTALVVTWKCNSGHSGRWSSQPQIGSSSMFTGNLQLAANILLTGNCFSKVSMLFSYMNLGCVSNSFFYNVQRFYTLPAIESYWASMQLDILTKLKKSEEPIVLAGDGRNDSPGHTAQYCTYTMMDSHTRQIVSLEIVDLREAPNSVAMEKIGFLRCMDHITKIVSVAEVVTDQSSSIALTMRTKYPNINHQWDVWHAAKNLEKKMTTLGNTKKTALLRTWAPSIRNHFWYCSKMCETNEDLLKETWMRILQHVCNKHEWTVSEMTTGCCAHAPLNADDDKKPWFESDSEAMEILRSVVMDRRLIGSMTHFTKFRHTGILETFHNHLLMYCSKRQSYQFPGYRARNLLAAIDYNHHVNRPDHLDQNGEARQKPRFNKRSKTWSVAPVKINKGYDYKFDIQCMVFEEKAKDHLPTNRRAEPREDDPRRISRTIAKVACPPKSELIAKQKSRF